MSLEKEEYYWKNELAHYKQFLKKNLHANYEDFQPIKCTAFFLITKLFSDKLTLKNSSFLEPGCGSAMVLIYLAKLGAMCIGIDHSKNALRFANKLIKEKSVGNYVKLLKRDMFTMPFRDNSFDMVFNQGVFEHLSLKMQKSLLKEMIRCSKKYVVVMIPNTQSPKYNTFIKSMKLKKRYYDVPEKNIDILNLFKKFNLKNIKVEGMSVFTNSTDINKEYTHPSLLRFYNKIKLKMSKSEQIILKDFPYTYYTQKHIEILSNIENRLSREEKMKFGFLRIFIGEK